MLNQALRDGRLSRDRFAILTYLYSIASRSTWVAQFSLDDLALAVGWHPFTRDYLHDQVAGLRNDGWIAYPRSRGGRGHVYVASLLWKGPEPSELSPSFQPLNHAENTPPAEPASPSFPPESPSFDPGSSPAAEPDSSRAASGESPSSLDVLDKTTLSVRKGYVSESLLEDPARETGDASEEPSSAVIAALEAVKDHAAVTNRKPTLAYLAAAARAAQRARDLASLSSLPPPERDLLTDLLVTFDGHLVDEATT